MDKYHEEGKFRQWINAVTVNLCRDYFRSRGHRQDAVQIHDEEVLEGISSSARSGRNSRQQSPSEGDSESR